MSVFRCTATYVYFSCVKNIPMSMTLCLAVGWRACQWFQKRSCISGLLSFSNTAITTVWSGERKVTEKQIIRYICQAECNSVTSLHFQDWRTFHLSRQIPLFFSHCHQLFAVSGCVFVCFCPLICSTKKRVVTYILKPTPLVHCSFPPHTLLVSNGVELNPAALWPHYTNAGLIIQGRTLSF